MRILLADDHDIVRDGIRRILQSQPGWSICAEAANGAEALERVREQRPDVAVLDLQMPGLSGSEVTRQIQTDNPETQVLILSMHNDEYLVRESFANGARGFILKHHAREELIPALTAVAARRTYLDPEFAGRFPEGAPEVSPITSRQPGDSRAELTPREIEVIGLLAGGLRGKEVAARLELSPKTVEAHRSNLMRKLRLHSLSELVLYAVRNNIVLVRPEGKQAAEDNPHLRDNRRPE